MIAPICHLVDRLVIRLASSRLADDRDAQPRLEEATALLRQSDFLNRPSPALELHFANDHDFTFPSAVSTASTVNNTVHGRLFRCPGAWRERPVVLMLHGWNDMPNYKYRFPWVARDINQAGLNCATMELPYHFHRRPSCPGEPRNFFSRDLFQTVQATGQGVADIRALSGALLAQGCPRVGLWGISMGAWLAGLACCHDAPPACAALMTPAARLDRMVAALPFCEPIRQGLMGRTFDFGSLNLVDHRPRIAKDKIVLIEALHDLFVRKETVEELWLAWDQPEIWRVPTGHITVHYSAQTTRRTIRWLSQKLARDI